MRKQGARQFEIHETRLLTEATRLFGSDEGSMTKLGAFESMVYEMTIHSRPHILKLTHDSHRTPNQIRGELEWTNYLGDNGVRVPRAVASVSGAFVEPIRVGETEFFAYAFQKSPGSHLVENDWNDDLFVKWGRITGRMHALTKKYQPSETAITRPSWSDDGFFKWIEEPAGKSPELDVLAMCHKYIRIYRDLPKDPDAFGLIHTDLHLWNFFVHNGEIIAFDFDDCRYDWFAHDLAIPLVYSLHDLRFGFQNNESLINFFRRFMEGYHSENEIDSYWLGQIPIFLKTREIDLYLIIKDEGIEDSNDWCRQFMKDRRRKIADDEPVIDLDFAKL